MDTPRLPLPPVDGLTLRDYFAAIAPDRYLNNEHENVFDAARIIGIDARDYDYKKHYVRVVAAKAYAYADAMLAERASTQPSTPEVAP